MSTLNPTVASSTPIPSLFALWAMLVAYLDRIAAQRVARGVSLFVADGKTDWRTEVEQKLATLNVPDQQNCAVKAVYGDFGAGQLRLGGIDSRVIRRPAQYGFHAFWPMVKPTNRAWARAVA